MKHNQHELPDVEYFARENGFDLLSLRRLSLIDLESSDQLHGSYAPEKECWRAYKYDDGMRLHRHDFICMEPFWFPTLLADGTVVGPVDLTPGFREPPRKTESCVTAGCINNAR